jgi:signal transduction histidine kinase
MSQKTASRVAWLAGVLAIVFTVGQTVFMFVDRHVPPPAGVDVLVSNAWNFANVFNNATNLAAAVIGAVLASKLPENRIGWLFLGAALAVGLSGFSTAYAFHALVADPGSLPAGRFFAWEGTWVGLMSVAIATLLFLLFPTGHPRSRLWAIITTAVLIGWAVTVSTTAVFAAMSFDLPFALPRSRSSASTLTFVLAFAVPVLGSFVAALAGMISRFRHSTGDERLQLKWFAAAAAFLVVAFLVGFLSNTPLAQAIQDLAVVFLLAAVAIAVLKYHLYEIDVVINRAVVYGTLGVFITFVYIGLVVGVGTVAGNNRSPFLSAVAAALVAVAFQPVRQWARRLANRVVFGSRATPYEVLSDFAERIAHTYAVVDVLPRMAEIVADGVGAQRAVVWLRLGDELRAEASSDGVPPSRRVPIVGGLPPTTLDGETAVPVTHHGDLLGAISVRMQRGEPLQQAGERLIADVASQAGLVLSNVQLIEELRASRQRIVSAQDQARRQLERNIHDGAQQQLVALSVKTKLARSLATTEPQKSDAMLEDIQGELSEAIENLRDLARGIYPPLLADQGLAAALQAQVKKSTIPTTIESVGIGRYPQDAEAAMYFCILEALQNVAKYANASKATVRLSASDGRLSFSVQDDGVGFDVAAMGYGTGMQGMGDRLAALGGELRVTSVPGTGTIVEGIVPAKSLNSAPAGPSPS